MIDIGKIVTGVGIVVLLSIFTPILDLLEMFFYVVLLPVAFLAAIGLMSEGSFNSLMSMPRALKDLKHRVDMYREVVPKAEPTL